MDNSDIHILETGNNTFLVNCCNLSVKFYTTFKLVCSSVKEVCFGNPTFTDLPTSTTRLKKSLMNAFYSCYFNHLTELKVSLS